MSEMNDDPIKAVWRSQPTEVPTMPISYLRHRARKLERSFRVRHYLEQSAFVLALILCVRVIAVAPHAWVKIGVALLLAGIVYSMVQWWRRARDHRSQGFESVDASLVFYRRELERQRDIHRTLWRWYMLPMAPGVGVILMWSFLGDAHTKGTLTPWIVLGMLLIWITLTVIYERAKAAQCQREIDALASVGGD
jgi:hypothetical protein